MKEAVKDCIKLYCCCCLQVDCSAGRAHHDRLTACVKSTAEENAGEEVLLLAVDALSQALQGLLQHSAPEQQSSSTPQQQSSVKSKTLLILALPVTLLSCDALPSAYERQLITCHHITCWHAYACSLCRGNACSLFFVNAGGVLFEKSVWGITESAPQG